MLSRLQYRAAKLCNTQAAPASSARSATSFSGVLCRLKLSQRLLLGLKLSQRIVSRVYRHVHCTKIYT